MKYVHVAVVLALFLSGCSSSGILGQSTSSQQYTNPDQQICVNKPIVESPCQAVISKERAEQWYGLFTSI
ncbi:hypothetical protein BIZ37_24550 [Photobacterium sp. BZF1]|nr:hypothetical protein [Photobacterium sp. BZF1]